VEEWKMQANTAKLLAASGRSSDFDLQIPFFDEKQRSCEQWIAIVQANPINQVNQSGKKNPDAAEDAAPPIGTGGPTGSLHVNK
jgi:hypothetical protein